jgi:hypothetical protein
MQIWTSLPPVSNIGELQITFKTLRRSLKFPYIYDIRICSFYLSKRVGRDVNQRTYTYSTRGFRGTQGVFFDQIGNITYDDEAN